MKKTLIVSILFMTAISLCGCSSAYESDGTVTVKNAKGNKVSYQIAEIGTAVSIVLCKPLAVLKCDYLFI